MTLNERMYWGAWARLPGVGPRRMARLQATFGSLVQAWQASGEQLRSAAIVPGKELEVLIQARRTLDPARAWEQDQQAGLRVICRIDPDYPEALTQLADAPAVLWVRGVWPLPERAVAIVGTRDASPYGLQQAGRLARELAAAGVNVVSGAASGIDGAAHRGALAHPPAEGTGLTTAVLGCGLLHVYPAHHRGLYAAIAQRGTLISELPPEQRAVPGAFPRRNRLIAALARGTLVVEARARSGSLITADCALELGREVLALPGPVGAPGSEGPHALLRDGAVLVESAQDVLNACGWPARPAPVRAARPEAEQRLLAALRGQPLSLSQLEKQLPLGLPVLSAGLLQLELAGLVRRLPGGLFAHL